MRYSRCPAPIAIANANKPLAMPRSLSGAVHGGFQSWYEIYALSCDAELTHCLIQRLMVVIVSAGVVWRALALDKPKTAVGLCVKSQAFNPFLHYDAEDANTTCASLATIVRRLHAYIYYNWLTPAYLLDKRFHF
jgi:hypothetical protein